MTWFLFSSQQPQHALEQPAGIYARNPRTNISNSDLSYYTSEAEWGMVYVVLRIQFNFDADSDPRSALEKNGSGSGSRLFHWDLLNYFLTKQNFQSLSYFFLFFMLKLDELFRNFSFFNRSELGFKSKKVFFSVFGWYLTPWIRIRGSTYFSVSGSRKQTSCGSNGSGS